MFTWFIMEQQPLYQRLPNFTNCDCYRDGQHNWSFLRKRGFVIKKVKDELPNFYDQLKVFGWEMLTEPILERNLGLVWKIYAILPIIEWLVPLSTICIQRKHIDES